MSVKLIILFVLSLIAGISFIAIGIYFHTQKFINKLNESAAVQDEVHFKLNSWRAHNSANIAIALGALTLVWAFMLFTFPQIAPALSLIYMIMLVIAFCFLNVVFKSTNNEQKNNAKF